MLNFDYFATNYEILSMTELFDYITNDFKPINSTEPIASVHDFLIDVSFSHFPVIDNGIFIGNIATEDVETFDSHKRIIDYKYALEGFFARKDMIWLDVLEVFAKNQTNIVPVLDQNNSYLGYYELETSFKFFNETPFFKEQGGIIVVKKNVLDYSIGQIVQIVENNNGKILGLFISEMNTENVEITIKIAIGAMNDIIQTFRRYNYEIISEHHEDNYLNSLKERSDYLDKYLSI